MTANKKSAQEARINLKSEFQTHAWAYMMMNDARKVECIRALVELGDRAQDHGQYDAAITAYRKAMWIVEGW